VSNAIATAYRRRQAATELKRFDLRTSDVVRYESGDGDDPDADEKEEASEADDGLTQTFED
jgi:hypothetical protein